MGLRNLTSWAMAAAVTLTAAAAAGCSSNEPNPDARPVVKPGSIPPPSDLPPAMMKKR